MADAKTVNHYRYDPLNRLTQAAGVQRFYKKSRMATDIQGAVQHSVFQRGDQLLAQVRREGQQVECALLATDLQRSVMQTLSPDNTQATVYNVYGYRPVGSGLLSVLGFNGERPDPLTGHYLLGNGYRAFNPVLMRFNSPDSWSPFGRGGMNSYGYCGGDPVNNRDPEGHSILKMLRPLLGMGTNKTATTKFKFLQEIIPDVFVAQEKLPWSINGRRLLINGHGASRVMGSGGSLVSAEQVWSSIQHKIKGVDLKKINAIKVIACNSGTGESSSFANELAQLSRLPVKGYKGSVDSYSGPYKYAKRRQKANQKVDINAVYIVRREYVVLKNHSYYEHGVDVADFNYEPVTYYPK